jgi:hypothetical protein
MPFAVGPVYTHLRDSITAAVNSVSKFGEGLLGWHTSQSKHSLFATNVSICVQTAAATWDEGSTCRFENNGRAINEVLRYSFIHHC